MLGILDLGGWDGFREWGGLATSGAWMRHPSGGARCSAHGQWPGLTGVGWEAAALCGPSLTPRLHSLNARRSFADIPGRPPRQTARLLAPKLSGVASRMHSDRSRLTRDEEGRWDEGPTALAGLQG